MSAPWERLTDEESFEASSSLLTGEDTYTKSAVLFCVDCSETMFRPLEAQDDEEDDDEVEDCWFSRVVEVVTGVLKDIIVNGNDDRVGVLFYNTREAKNDNQSQHVYVFTGDDAARQQLDGPDAPIIKTLERLTPAEFERKIGRAPQRAADFANVLWAAGTVFQLANLKKTHKRLFLFTDHNDPCGSPDARSRAVIKAEDLDANDISMELFPMNRDFDPRLFWGAILSIDDDEDIGGIRLQFSDSFESLQRTVRLREFKKRSLASVPFVIGPDVCVGIKIYCLLKEATKDYGRTLHRGSNAPLTCITKWLCNTTGMHLQEHEITTYHTYGDRKVFFTKDEMKEIKDFGEPGLTLLGFKSRSRLKLYHNIKQPYFVYPDEEAFKGSTVAFHALLRQMAAHDKIAIARLIYRRQGIPRFVALLPQLEELDADGIQQTPPGMHLIFLPYADDIRALKFESTPRAPPAVVEKANTLTNKLVIEFDDTTFENPALQKHYAVLQAVGLDEKQPEIPEDTLVPDEEAFARRAKYFEAFKEAAGLGAPSDEPAPAKKRKAAGRGGGGGEGGAAKHAKVDWSEYSGSEEKLKKLTIPQLKDYCREKGLRLAGKKGELVARVWAHMQED